jgi:hypothetical protein
MDVGIYIFTLIDTRNPLIIRTLYAFATAINQILTERRSTADVL